MTAAALRNEWIKVVKTNLHEDTRNSRSDFVKDYLRRPVAQEDLLTDKGFAFALDLQDKYRRGLHLSLPDVNGWLINPDQFLGSEWNLGTFEDSMVLATMCMKDPSPVMALAALARLAPRATTQEIVEELVGGIGQRSKHEQVRDTVIFLRDHQHRPSAIKEAQQSVSDEIRQIRAAGFECLKEILRLVMEAKLAPRDFVDQFFGLCERCTIRPDIYTQMLINLMNSPKIRPLVKLILLESVDRMPVKVRYQVYTTVNNLSDMHENHYLKQELAFLLERERQPEPSPIQVRDVVPSPLSIFD